MNVRQNAQVIVNAERYYRAMITAGPTSWNIRDRHMVHTLDLMEFHGLHAKELSGNTILIEMLRELRICVMMEQ
jgi:erythromycin esterase-like protein